MEDFAFEGQELNISMPQHGITSGQVNTNALMSSFQSGLNTFFATTNPAYAAASAGISLVSGLFQGNENRKAQQKIFERQYQMMVDQAQRQAQTIKKRDLLVRSADFLSRANKAKLEYQSTARQAPKLIFDLAAKTKIMNLKTEASLMQKTPAKVSSPALKTHSVADTFHRTRDQLDFQISFLKAISDNFSEISSLLKKEAKGTDKTNYNKFIYKEDYTKKLARVGVYV